MFRRNLGFRAVQIRILAIIVSAAGLLSAALPALAADPAFVGRLALVVEDDIAEKIGLSQETYQALVTLIDRREAEVANLAVDRSLSAEEREKQLAPFVAESERLGLALLSEEQQQKLQQLRIAREGLVSLGEAEIAKQLNLSDEQKTQIETLLKERQTALGEGGETDQRLARNEFERRLRSVLTDEQFAGWEKAAGLLEARDAVAQAPTPPEEDPASENPPAEKTTPAEAPVATAPASSAPAAPSNRAAPSPSSRAPSPTAAPAPRNDEPLATDDAEAPREDARLKFQFRYAPWKDVIEWFAQQANLSLEGEAPPGTFNYTDSRSYSPAEALDVLNGVLLTKGFTMMRRDRMLFVVNLEDLKDGISPHLVTRITPEELDKRGEYEIISVLFPLTKMTAAQAETELRPLIGRPGELVILPLSKQVRVTGTAGNVKTIRRVMEAIDHPKETKDLSKFKVQNVSPEEFLVVARKLMGIPDDANGAEDGTIRFTADPLSNYIFVTGQPDAIERFEKILKMVEEGGADVSPSGSSPLEASQLEVYPITDADPTSVLQVLQTVLAGLPGVRLAIDPVTGNLIALAKPAEHATIKATLLQLQKETRSVTVLRLRRLDPQLAVVSINRMFGGGTGDKVDPKAPIVDADPTTGVLLVRGSQTQVTQIKDLLQQMGETPETLDGNSVEGELGSSPLLGSGKVRMLPFTGRGARDVLEQVELLWPTVSQNRIRIVRSSAAIDSRRWNGEGGPSQRGGNVPGAGGSRPQNDAEQPNANPPANQPPNAQAPANQRRAAGQEAAARDEEGFIGPVQIEFVEGFDAMIIKGHPNDVEHLKAVKAIQRPPQTNSPASGRPSAQRGPAPRSHIRKVVVGSGVPSRRLTTAADLAEVAAMLSPLPTQVAETSRGAQFAVERHFIAQVEEENPPPAPAEKTEPAPQAQENAPPPAGEKAPAEIIVKVTPSGIIIASHDEEALDRFETMMQELYDMTPAPTSEYTVFYLRYIQASAAAELLTQLITGAPPDEGGGAGGGLMGNIANAALGNLGGGLVGGLLGGGGASSTSTYSSTGLSIVPEPRLNALMVQATPTQLDAIEQLLTVIDQETGPDAIQILPPPRMIPVYNTGAEAIATTVRNIYAQQIASGAGQQRQPSPEDFIRALSGGRGGRAGGRNEQPTQQMTVSVDARSNSLVVAAAEPLFQSVKALVEALDQPGLEPPSTTQVVSIQGANSATLKQALTAALGDVIKTGTTASTSNTASGSQPGGDQRPPGSDDARDQMRQRMEAFNALQRGGGGGGAPGGFGGFGGGNPFGGGGGRGFGGFGGGGGGNPFGGGGFGGGNRGGRGGGGRD